MIPAGCVAVNSRTAYNFILFIFFSSLFGLPRFAASWDSKGAALAFEQARQKRSEITQDPASTIQQYLECARTYRSVHLKDPHYGRAGDAIYEEGLVYQEIADRFSKPDYYRTAVDRFNLLVRDYGGNPNCPNALIRVRIISSKRLEDETAAQDAYRRLRSQYGLSETSIRRMEARLDSETVRTQPVSGPVSPEIAKTPAPAIESRARPLSMVQNVRFWSMSDYTRVIIDIDSNVKYEKARLSDPERIYFDISNARLTSDLINRTFAVGGEILKTVRAAQKGPDLVRIVLDLTAAGSLSVSELHDPFRIVVDLQRTSATAQPAQLSAKQESERLPPANPVAAPASQGTVTQAKQAPLAVTEARVPASRESIPSPAAGVEKPARARTAAETRVSELNSKVPTTAKTEISAPPREAALTSRGDRTLTRILGLKVGRIVIDPGHGGHDFGTIGPGGLPEKNLVLSLALSLRKMIQEKLGAEVILTREDDTFIPLDERTAMANRHKADLFISLHANSSRNHSISGVETYYLDFAKTDAEREIAARENATTVSNVSDLEDLIKKIAKADKSAESRELASSVQKKLYSGVRRMFRSTQNRGVRSAPFIVLIGANMPSVLAEVAFISNPKDERLLGRETTRQNLVKALFAGIDGYLKTLGSDVVQNQRSSPTK